MPSVTEKLQTVNSFIRTILALVVMGGLGGVGWYGYTTYHATEIESKQKEQRIAEVQQTLASREQDLAESKSTIDQQQRTLREHTARIASQQDMLDRQEGTIDEQTEQIAGLNVELEQKSAEIARLDTALRLHKMERRLARIIVKEVTTDEDSGKRFARIEFVELNELGDPIGEAKTFELEGDVVYLDYLVVKFEDKYIEQADLLRGTSICMFNRIFGEFQKPNDGFYLDQPGSRPGTYARGGAVSELEAKIWDDFWSLANKPEQLKDLGIRTLHGDAVSIKVVAGNTYRITVRSAGGPEIEVAEVAEVAEDVEDSSIEEGAAIFSWEGQQPVSRRLSDWLPLRDDPTTASSSRESVYQ